ncbi:MAG: hypothetical protein EOP20_01350 [Hyphomicrobiales bacterium]|nr:MAG: hypothetical protein EOP20_01350 [Hyphomicrobiales bacterium]
MKLLSEPERNWLNEFHRRVWDEIGPKVSGDVKTWLHAATAVI